MSNTTAKAADLPRLRKDYERQQAEIIRFQTQLESLEKQINEIQLKAKNELGVTSLEELRTKTKTEMKDHARQVDSFAVTLGRRRAILDHVKERLAGLEQ